MFTLLGFGTIKMRSFFLEKPLRNENLEEIRE